MAAQTEQIKNVVHAYLESEAELVIRRVSGGDIHSSYSVRTINADAPTLFLKSNDLRNQAVLRSEYTSLMVFRDFQNLNYPSPLHFTNDDHHAYLLMEYVEIGPLEEGGFSAAARMLAEQHENIHSHYGWKQDNYIGLTPQVNTRAESWPEFFKQFRLLPQLRWAKNNGLDESLADQIELLGERLEEYLGRRNLQASLLHGDLWGGNIGFDQQRGIPIFYDPAPYYGDPDADLAMTELFGGFGSKFYENYWNLRVKESGYEVRKAIYNLYHALNHFNLFGPTYSAFVHEMLRVTKIVT